MNTSFRRAVAAASVCAAGLAGALISIPAADAGATPQRADRPVKTQVGYKAAAIGTKLLVDGVEVRTAKTAFAQQKCTRYAGREVIRGTDLTSLGIPLVAGGLTTSRTETYRTSGVHGSRAISTIADLELGGEFQGQQTSTLKLSGLTSTADSFRRADGTFGHAESFRFEGLSIGNLPDQVPAELQELLDLLGSTTGDVVNQVLELLSTVTGNEIEIPGLGSIGLAGVKKGGAGDHSAWSTSFALRLTVTATGHPTEITLGRARSEVSEPVPAGVFHSSTMGLILLGGNDALQLGGLEEKSIGCSGTGGKVRTHTLDTVRVLGGLVNLTGVEYALMGDQSARGAARGFVSTTIGSLEVPSIGLVIDGIRSKVTARKAAETVNVKRRVDTAIARITLDGQELELPTFAGQKVDLGEHGFLEYRVLGRNNHKGVEVRALTLTLPDLIPGGSILDLGWAGLHITPN